MIPLKRHSSSTMIPLMIVMGLHCSHTETTRLKSTLDNKYQKGVITIKADDVDGDELALSAIDAGAEDVKVESDYVEVYTTPEDLENVRKALEEQNLTIESSEISMVPKTLVQLDEKSAAQALKLMDKLEEIDDVQNVFSNADFPDSILESYQSQ